MHKHKCDGCGRVWAHSESNAGNKKSHTCTCGKEVWDRHHGPEEAEVQPDTAVVKARAILEDIVEFLSR